MSHISEMPAQFNGHNHSDISHIFNVVPSDIAQLDAAQSSVTQSDVTQSDVSQAPHWEPLLPVDDEALQRRLDAQAHAAQQPGRGAGNLNDPIARRRDEEGQPQPGPLVYLSPGLLSGRPLAETGLPQLLKRLADRAPVRAEWLGLAYEDGVRFNKTQFDDLDRLERESRAHQNREIERRNKALAALQNRLEREREAQTLCDREALVALDEPLRQAHHAAASAVAHAGGDYDPIQPTSASVLRAQPLPLEVVVGGNGLPWTPTDDEKRIPHWLLHTLKLGVGIAIGLSIGLFAHFFDPSNVGQKPAELMVAIGLGYVAAAGGGWAVRGSTRRAAERYWLARFGHFAPSFWVPAALFAALVGVTLIVAEATVETLGLLGAAQLQKENEGGTVLPWFVFYIAGLLVTVGYMVTQANEGAFDGRREVCSQRAQWLQHEEFAPREMQERASQKVQDALEALGRVRETLRQIGHLETRIAHTAQPFEAKIAALKSLKREPLTGLSDDAKQRLRDAHHNWCGANGDWHAELHTLIDEIEPKPVRGQRHIAPGDHIHGSHPAGAPRGLLTHLRQWWRRTTRR